MGRHKKTHLGNLAKVVRKHSIRPLTSNEPTNITEFLPQIKIDLEKLSRKYENCVDCYGLVTDLSKILHCDNDNASRYAVFELNGKIYSIRISGHNANCDNYEDHAPNDFNLILVLERQAKPNRFNANENVVAEEYVYTNDRVRNIQNPFSKIILAIKRYLETGVYIDPLPQGTSYQHISPNNNAETQSTMIKNGLGNVVQSLQNRERQDDWIFPRPILESYAIYIEKAYNMKKIRLNESQFNRIVSKCVKKALNEGRYRSIDENEAYEMLMNALSGESIRDLVESKIYQIANSIQNQSNPLGQNKGYIVNSKSGGLSNNVLAWLKWAGTSFEEVVNDFISQVR